MRIWSLNLPTSGKRTVLESLPSAVVRGNSAISTEVVVGGQHAARSLARALARATL